jgi:hypothetical protein
MTGRELLAWCASSVAMGSALVLGPHGLAQQPGRARVNAPPVQQQPAQQQPAQPRPPASQEQLPQGEKTPRPAPNSVEVQMPRELEELLVHWERESSKISKLRGTVARYEYDSVFAEEKRSQGQFWYVAPDQGRMDFGPVRLPEPAINPDKLDPKGQPYKVKSEGSEKWICTGKEIYVIHDDQKLFSRIQIPPNQQGRNIINGPLPFLFGMKADQAKARYHMSLGGQHWPRGVRANEQGEQVQVPPQIHVVAHPKLAADAQNWSRAEVLLDPGTFLPRGMRLLDPTGNKETVYVFPAKNMKVDEVLPWLPSPFAERPPRDYTLDFDSRAASEEAALDAGIAPGAAPARKQ